MSAHATVKLDMSAPHLAMTMILGNLKKIGVDENDTVLICCDYLKSWRKEYAPEYKANREEARKKSPVDFETIFQEFNLLLDNVERGTNWNVLKVPNTEADDIMAVASRYYKNKEVILLTADSDMEQLWEYDNVKIFSPHRLLKRYKIKPKNFNPYNLIAKKIRKEIADNLVSNIENEEDYDNRELCVNLLELPEWVENKIIEKLDKVEQKFEYDSSYLPGKIVQERYNGLCQNKSQVITYEQCVKKVERKNRRKKK